MITETLLGSVTVAVLSYLMEKVEPKVRKWLGREPALAEEIGQSDGHARVLAAGGMDFAFPVQRGGGRTIVLPSRSVSLLAAPGGLE